MTPALFVTLIKGPLDKAKERFDAGETEIVFGTGKTINDISKLGITKVYFKEKGYNSIIAEAELGVINQNILAKRLEDYKHETWPFYYGFKNLKYLGQPIPMSSLRYYRSNEPLKNTVRSNAIIHDPKLDLNIDLLPNSVEGNKDNILSIPSLGEVLTNDDITKRFLVGTMGGMRRNLEDNLLVLISDPFKGLYQDRWENNILHYTGMGQNGDQSLAYNQNKTLAQSPSTGIALHLLEALEPKQYTYIGKVELAGEPYEERQHDENGQERLVWMFPLKPASIADIPVLSVEQAKKIEASQARIAVNMGDNDLKRRAQNAKRKPGKRQSTTTVYVRDVYVAQHTKRLAKGQCDLCESPAPFLDKEKEAYLECHHIVWLANGGEDVIENTVALCPNCHRKMHIVNDQKDREKLSKRALGRVK